MGYTHYFTTNGTIPQKDWEALTNDVQLLFKNTNVTIAGWDGKGEPEVDLNGIRFNGLATLGHDHETFFLSNKGEGFGFCKTAYKPYDEVVTAVLIRAKDYFGELIEVSSDGSWGDWANGRYLYEATFGETASNPFAVGMVF